MGSISSLADHTGIIFFGPSFDSFVKLDMATNMHEFKIAQVIIKGVFINMMYQFTLLKFAAKVLFHDPAVLIRPSQIGRRNLNLDIFDSFKGGSSWAYTL